MCQDNIHFPKLYSFGKNYIIREFIDGIELNKYLIDHIITDHICYNLVDIYKSMRKSGFKRLDTAIFHIFVTFSNEFKVIDISKAMKKDSIRPNILLKDLKSLGCLNYFLSYVKEHEIKIYQTWNK